MKGIDLSDGQTLWRRIDIVESKGWSNFVSINDSIDIIVSAGLHLVNINNGKGWDREAITEESKSNFSGAAFGAGMALGILAGIFTGFYMVPVPYGAGLLSSLL